MFVLLTALCLPGLFFGLSFHHFQSKPPRNSKAGIKGYFRWAGPALWDSLSHAPKILSTHVPSLFKDLPCGLLEKILAAGLGLSFTYLALSGLVFALIPGVPIHGLFLVLHVILGGMFAICLTLLVLFRAGDFFFDSTRAEAPVTQETIIWKALFWLIAAGGAMLILTALVPMLPLLTHTGQIQALSLHRFASLFTLLAFISFIYFGLQSRKE